MPAVSIAIRAFRRRWLAEAIASVLAQTHRDLELVIYDDAGDLEALATATGDPRVRYHRAEERRTASGRFTAAVAQCRGEYIGILDDDDAYAPDFVAALVQAPRRGSAVRRGVLPIDLGRRRDADRPGGSATGRPPGRLCGVDAAPRLVDGVLGDADPAQRPRGGAARSAAAAGRRAGYVHQPAHRAGGLDARPGGRPAVAAALARQSVVAHVSGGWRHVGRDVPPPRPSRIRSCAVARDRQLARSHLVRALDALRAGDVRRGRVDVGAAASLAPAAWRAERRALALAVACGPAGVLAARLWAAWSPRGRRRARPPRSDRAPLTGRATLRRGWRRRRRRTASRRRARR